MLYLTTREKSKVTTKPWFSRLLRHQPGNGVGLFMRPTSTKNHFTDIVRTL